MILHVIDIADQMSFNVLHGIQLAVCVVLSVLQQLHNPCKRLNLTHFYKRLSHHLAPCHQYTRTQSWYLSQTALAYDLSFTKNTKGTLIRQILIFWNVLCTYIKLPHTQLINTYCEVTQNCANFTDLNSHWHKNDKYQVHMHIAQQHTHGWLNCPMLWLLHLSPHL